jgi:hypothetical protein
MGEGQTERLDDVVFITPRYPTLSFAIGYEQIPGRQPVKTPTGMVIGGGTVLEFRPYVIPPPEWNTGVEETRIGVLTAQEIKKQIPKDISLSLAVSLIRQKIVAEAAQKEEIARWEEVNPNLKSPLRHTLSFIEERPLPEGAVLEKDWLYRKAKGGKSAEKNVETFGS